MNLSRQAFKHLRPWHVSCPKNYLLMHDMHGNLAALRRLVIANVFASSLLMCSACGSSDEENAVAQEIKKPFGVGSIKKANAELEEAVRAKLDSDPELRGSQIAVSADVTRNQVTISGAVASKTLSARAVELAKSAQAGVIVNNKISVKSKASKSSRKTWYA